MKQCVKNAARGNGLYTLTGNGLPAASALGCVASSPLGYSGLWLAGAAGHGSRGAWGAWNGVKQVYALQV